MTIQARVETIMAAATIPMTIMAVVAVLDVPGDGNDRVRLRKMKDATRLALQRCHLRGLVHDCGRGKYLWIRSREER